MPEDIAAAYKANENLQFLESSDILWMDVVYKGVVPYADGLYKMLSDLMKPGDLELISQPLDYFGVNLYASEYIVSDNKGGYIVLPKKTGAPLNSLRWNVVPEVMFWGPKYFYERYGLPIVITENGYCSYDDPSEDGRILDFGRANFIQKYLQQLSRAVQSGIPIEGYFYWSLMDNFEWVHGYDERFGLIYVDYTTRKRTIKESGKYYKKIIQSNGKHLDMPII